MEVLDDCDTALREDPSLLRLHVRKGKALLKLGNFAQADEALRRVLESPVASEQYKTEAKVVVKQVFVFEASH